MNQIKAPQRSGPRLGNRLSNFLASRDSNNQPVFEDGLVYVSVEGQHPRKAILGEKDYLRITGRDCAGPWLTKTRWWMDEDNMLRAYSLHETPLQHGVLVAAAVVGAREGDSIEVSGDPFDVRRSQIRPMQPDAAAEAATHHVKPRIDNAKGISG
ncbi:hypothetical protein [uncultured Variovorax sp.]|uniref:hypothetical protein n=1 Tax=uncultured Variovorax sp. TaxID=114708 RepID=UPI0025F76DF6|nr:hypothetical protein [uncultured Variovorax sp.]